MYVFLITIHVIACLVLVLVILLQAGRGVGLSETFGMSSTSTIFGTSASKFLQTMTAVCAGVFLLTSLSLTVLSSHRSKSLMKLEHLKKALPAPEKPAGPAASLPADIESKIGGEEEAPVEKEAESKK